LEFTQWNLVWSSDRGFFIMKFTSTCKLRRVHVAQHTRSSKRNPYFKIIADFARLKNNCNIYKLTESAEQKVYALHTLKCLFQVESFAEFTKTTKRLRRIVRKMNTVNMLLLQLLVLVVTFATFTQTHTNSQTLDENTLPPRTSIHVSALRLLETRKGQLLYMLTIHRF